MSEKDSLGAEVCVHRIPKSQSIGFMIVGAICLCFSLLSPLLPVKGGFMAGFVMFPFGLIALIRGFFSYLRSRQVTYFHVHGVRVVRGGGTKTFSFEDVERVSFSSTNIRVNGIPADAAQRLALVVRGMPKPIVIHSEGKQRYKNVARMSLEKLAQRAVLAVSRKMAATLAAHGSVGWTNGYVITRDRLESPDGASIRWGRINSVTMVNGSCVVTEEGSFRRVIPAGSPNLLSGYEIARQLAERAHAHAKV